MITAGCDIDDPIPVLELSGIYVGPDRVGYPAYMPLVNAKLIVIRSSAGTSLLAFNSSVISSLRVFDGSRHEPFKAQTCHKSLLGYGRCENECVAAAKGLNLPKCESCVKIHAGLLPFSLTFWLLLVDCHLLSIFTSFLSLKIIPSFLLLRLLVCTTSKLVCLQKRGAE